MKKLILWVISAIISISGVQDIGILSSDQIDINYGNHTCYSSEWKVTKEPSCTETGEESLYCNYCNTLIDTRTVEALGHDYKDCVCTRCWDTAYVDENSKTIIVNENTLNQYGVNIDKPIGTIPSKLGEYTVVGIGNYLFNRRDDLIEVNLPDTITYIGMYAFNDCVNLRKINWGNSQPTYIGYASFQCCYKLKELTIPDSVQYIGNYAYNHLFSISNNEVFIPNNLSELGGKNLSPAHMFYDCGSENFTAFSGGSKECPVIDGILYSDKGKTLASIPSGKSFKDNTYVMPDSVENLGELSFSRNKNIDTVILSNNLIVSSNVRETFKCSQYINNGNELSVAIYGYTNINRYEVKEDNKHYTAKNGILYSKDGTHLVAIPNDYSGEIILEEGVTVWYKNALWSEVDYFINQSLNKITKVYLPSTLKYIDDTQISILNKIHEYYGTELSVSDKSNILCIKDGLLVRK